MRSGFPLAGLSPAAEPFSWERVVGVGSRGGGRLNFFLCMVWHGGGGLLANSLESKGHGGLIAWMCGRSGVCEVVILLSVVLQSHLSGWTRSVRGRDKNMFVYWF